MEFNYNEFVEIPFEFADKTEEELVELGFKSSTGGPCWYGFRYPEENTQLTLNFD